MTTKLQFCLKGEIWESKWEVWGSNSLHRRTLGGTKRNLGESYICYRIDMSKLALDLSQNYYQTTFCSF
jgi:hypothetical protein